MLVYANNSNFEEHTSKGVVLVDFFASWCGPCKMIGPVLEEMAKERDDFNIVKVDVDENQDLAMKYGVMSIPTLVIFKDGKLVSQKLGFMPKELLLKWIEENK
jgi:thioredoxin 1